MALLDLPSLENFVAAEQQLHITMLERISTIQDPAEKAEAEAVEADRRWQRELALGQTR